MMPLRRSLILTLGAILFLAGGCSDDDEAAALGVGAACTKDSDCSQDCGQKCLLQFKGGYCGSTGCTGSADCSKDAVCVNHTDGSSYCFKSCTDKTQCNANRGAGVEASCSDNLKFISGQDEGKACVPTAAPPADASIPADKSIPAEASTSG